ncbi:MAG: 30S ribosomal protein S2 [Thermomicrobiales bacterium]
MSSTWIKPRPHRHHCALEFVKENTANGGKILLSAPRSRRKRSLRLRSGPLEPVLHQSALAGRHTDQLHHHPRPWTEAERSRHRAPGRARAIWSFCPSRKPLNLRSELERLQRTFGGMRDMIRRRLALFVIDPKREHLAMAEAQKLKIPVIAITDTNANPIRSTTSFPATTTPFALFAR